MTRLMQALTTYMRQVTRQQEQTRHDWLREIIDELPRPAPARARGYGAFCDYRR